MSHTFMINLLDLIGGHFRDKIVELVKARKKFFTVNDNLNCKTTVKNMRVDHRTSSTTGLQALGHLLTFRIFLLRITSLPQRKSRNFTQISKFLWGESF